MSTLRHRINEKKELNSFDVALCEDAAQHIRNLEGSIAVLLDELHHKQP
jgi:hypothetical protein